MKPLLPLPPTNADEFTKVWQQFYLRWQNRDERMRNIDSAVAGDWAVFDPNDSEEMLTSRSPNLVQVALEDTAEASTLRPSIRVHPSSVDPRDKERAEIMEKLGSSYLDASKFSELAGRSFLNLYAYGMFSWVTTCDENGPRIEWRDPRTCFPEPDYTTLGTTKRCFFARDLYLSQLPIEWQAIFARHCAERNVDLNGFRDKRITFVEYYDDMKVVLAGVYNAATVDVAGVTFLNTTPNLVSVILKERAHPLGMCPVVIGQRRTLDPEPHGQFDQAIDILRTHIQLMALVLDYADQSVHSPVFVKDLIGQLVDGPGGYIQLGPQGQIGRLAPASPSFSLFNELQQLIEAFHIASRWPKNRTGEVDQSQASGKMIETTVAVMNQVVRTGHEIMMEALTQAQNLCFAADRKLGKKRTVAGIRKNQRFLMERKADDIDPKALVEVTYGLGFGRDPQSSAVLAIQYAGAGFLSRMTAQENIEGIDDVGLERRRLVLEQVTDMALAQILQGLQDKSIRPKALVEIARAVENGQDVIEVFNEFIVKPQEKELEGQYPSGMTGEMMSPGAPPAALGAGGGMPPQAPPPEELMGLLGAGAGPEAPSTIGRLSTPLPGGGFAGSESRG